MAQDNQNYTLVIGHSTVLPPNSVYQPFFITQVELNFMSTYGWYAVSSFANVDNPNINHEANREQPVKSLKDHIIDSFRFAEEAKKREKDKKEKGFSSLCDEISSTVIMKEAKKEYPDANFETHVKVGNMIPNLFCTNVCIIYDIDVTQTNNTYGNFVSRIIPRHILLSDLCEQYLNNIENHILLYLCRAKYTTLAKINDFSKQNESKKKAEAEDILIKPKRKTKEKKPESEKITVKRIPWTQHYNKSSNKYYYYNNEIKKSIWEPDALKKGIVTILGPPFVKEKCRILLAENWKVRRYDKDNYYYRHTQTKKYFMEEEAKTKGIVKFLKNKYAVNSGGYNNTKKIKYLGKQSKKKLSKKKLSKKSDRYRKKMKRRKKK